MNGNIILRVHMATKSVNENNNTSAPVGSGSDFPKHSLKAALRVANALEEMNSGNPMPPTDVAIAIGKSPGSSDFRMLLSSSIKYGLTTGSYNQSKVSLTALAREILEPTSDESRNKGLAQAAFMPPVLGRIFDSYKSKKVPDPQFFQNALVRDFGVPRDQAARCAAIFQDNVEFLGLLRQASTGKWLAAEPLGPIGAQIVDSSESDEAEGNAMPVADARGPSVLAAGRATGSVFDSPVDNAD